MSAYTVYRHFDADDRLLYVGATVNYPGRCSHHAARSPWWSEVARSVEVRGLDADAAATLEREIIATEHPVHNTSKGGDGLRSSGRPHKSRAVTCEPNGEPTVRLAKIINAQMDRAGVGRLDLSKQTGTPLLALERFLNSGGPLPWPAFIAIVDALDLDAHEVIRSVTVAQTLGIDPDNYLPKTGSAA